MRNCLRILPALIEYHQPAWIWAKNLDLRAVWHRLIGCDYNPSASELLFQRCVLRYCAIIDGYAVDKRERADSYRTSAS